MMASRVLAPLFVVTQLTGGPQMDPWSCLVWYGGHLRMACRGPLDRVPSQPQPQPAPPRSLGPPPEHGGQRSAKLPSWAREARDDMMQACSEHLSPTFAQGARGVLPAALQGAESVSGRDDTTTAERSESRRAERRRCPPSLPSP